MKSKLVIFIASIVGLVSANGAVYNVLTGSSATSNGIAPTFPGTLSNIGAPALTDFDPTTPGDQTFTGFQASGIVGIGIFSSLSDSAITSATSLSSIYSDFTVFGVTGTFTSAGPTGARGTFSRNTAGTVLGSVFDNKNIYILIGNATTYEASTQLLVLKNTQLFLADQDNTPTALNVPVTTATSTLLFGVNLADVRTTSTDSSVTPGWGTAAIPEPSAALLGALGALGLLRRRRI